MRESELSILRTGYSNNNLKNPGMEGDLYDIVLKRTGKAVVRAVEGQV